MITSSPVEGRAVFLGDNVLYHVQRHDPCQWSTRRSARAGTSSSASPPVPEREEIIDAAVEGVDVETGQNRIIRHSVGQLPKQIA